MIKQSASLALTMRNVENQNKRNEEIQKANQVAPEKQVRIRSRKLKLLIWSFNPYRTEKKSSLQDCSGFSEPLSSARIFVALALYEHEFLDL